MDTVDADNESNGNRDDDDADVVSATVGSTEKPEEGAATLGETTAADDRFGEEGRRNKIVDRWLCVHEAVGVTALVIV
jgi:hypothetical protein